MKVYFDSQIFLLQKYGGISNYFAQIIKQFIENPTFDVQPIMNFNTSSNVHLQEMHSQNVGIKAKNQKFLKTFLGNSFRNPKEIKEAEIVHFTYYMPSKLLNNKKIIKVSTIHDFIPERYYARTSRGRYSHYLKHQYINKSDGFIFVSEFTRKLAHSYYESIGIKPNCVIYHGAQTKGLINKHKNEIGKKYFLYVGKRSEYKNFKFLLEVFSKISRQNNIALVCYGGGEQEKNIENLINKNNMKQSVIFLDDKYYDLDNLYQNAIAFINPSQEEGFGMANLEAFSNGCPVICSDIAVFKEILGDQANYFSLDSQDSLFKQLNKFIKETYSIHQREVLIRKSREYSWSEAARQTADFYRSLKY